MKLRVLIGIVLLISLAITVFHNQAELIEEQSTSPSGEKKLSFIPHTNAVNTEEKIEANIASMDNSASEAPLKTTENKEEQLALPENGIEHSIEFIDPNSELHEKLLEAIKKKMSEKVLLKIRPGEKGVDLDGESYTTYTSDIGIEFFRDNIKWHKQFENVDDVFNRLQELQAQELESLGDWNSKNESIIYQLVEKFNYQVEEEHDLAQISPVNVDCRGNICSVHFSHPTDLFKGTGKASEAVGKELKGVLAFMVFFKKQRSWCKCRGFESFSEGWNESSFRFVFD